MSASSVRAVVILDHTPGPRGALALFGQLKKKKDRQATRRFQKKKDFLPELVVRTRPLLPFFATSISFRALMSPVGLAS